MWRLGAQAALADQSRSEEQRRQLKEAAKRQLADMEALQVGA
jgi:hypothetical protein